MDRTMPLVEVRDTLGQRVDAAHFADEVTVITKNGTPRAVLVAFETFQTLRGAAGARVGHDPARRDSHTLVADAADSADDQR